jgi:hypothetical protein
MGMSEKLFETALGIGAPWFVAEADFNAPARTLTIRVDFIAGTRFAVSELAGEHPVHDTVSKRYRHLNFFQHECFLEVRVPRVKLPDGAVRQIEPPWAGKLSGFTLLFEALVLMLCQQMTFAAAARLVGQTRHRVAAICERYVDLALAQADFSTVHELAIDETSRARGHDYASTWTASSLGHPPDQRIPRSAQRPVSVGQATRTRLRSHVDHPHGYLPNSPASSTSE